MPYGFCIYAYFSLTFAFLFESFIIECYPGGVFNKHCLLSLFSFPLCCGSVCVSVCLSVTKSCPLYNLITVTDISMKLHTFVKHIETKCHAQEP